MIEFEGMASEKIKGFLLRRLFLGVFFAGIIIFCIIGIPGILIAIYDKSFVLLIVFCGGFLLANILVPYNVSYNIPYKIWIEGKIIFGKYKETDMSGEIINVKQVLDYGDFYHITFYYPRWGTCLCQKNLISYGVDCEELMLKKTTPDGETVGCTSLLNFSNYFTFKNLFKFFY